MNRGAILLDQVKLDLQRLTLDDRARIETIAVTFRNIVRSERSLGVYALKLVAAELAAASGSREEKPWGLHP